MNAGTDKTVGNIRILKPLSEGARGTVYLGFDRRLKRKVAVKAIHPERQNIHSKARFLKEARILSGIKNPGICRIFDFVEEVDNTYVILEYVHGKNLAAITETLNHQQKLRIAKQIAGVLVDIHSKEIIHRDLKPANIIVDKNGDVKVLDFEIAFSSAAQPSNKTMGFSMAGSTEPDTTVFDLQDPHLREVICHMSPEQVCGRQVSPAADMYSFGLLLQQLFTGKSPYQPGLANAAALNNAAKGKTLPVEGVDKDLTALITQLKSTVPKIRPSAAAALDQLQWIAAKPKRRRQRFTAVVICLITLLAALKYASDLKEQRNIAIRASIDAEAARADAVIAREKAKETAEFLVGLFAVPAPAPSGNTDITARELLDRGAEKIQTELSKSPETKAEILMTLAEVYNSLGLHGPAEKLLTTGLSTLENSVSKPTRATGALLSLLGETLWYQGNFRQAKATLTDALIILREHPQPNETAITETLCNLGTVYQSLGDLEQAEIIHKECLTIQKRLLGDSHYLVGKAQNNLAVFYRQQGRLAEAERLYRSSLRIIEKELGSSHITIAIRLNNLAILLMRQDKLQEAEPLLQRSLRIQAANLEPDHPNIGQTLNALGGLYITQEKFSLAKDCFERALVIRQKAFGEDHPRTATVMQNLAHACWKLGDFSAAETYFLRQIASYENKSGKAYTNLAKVLSRYAKLKIAQGELEDAERLIKRALLMIQNDPNPPTRTLAAIRGGLANLLRDQQRFAEAVPLYQEALEELATLTDRNHPDLIKLQEDQRRCLDLMGAMD